MCNWFMITVHMLQCIILPEVGGVSLEPDADGVGLEPAEALDVGRAGVFVRLLDESPVWGLTELVPVLLKKTE